MHTSESKLSSTPSPTYQVKAIAQDNLETVPPVPPWQVEVVQELMDIVTSLVFEAGMSKLDVKYRLLQVAGSLTCYSTPNDEEPSPWVVPF